MKKKIDRTNKKTEGTGFDFARTLHALDQLGSAISKNIQPSQHNAQKIKDEIDAYGRLSDSFSREELSEKQKSELRKVREKYRDALKDIRRQLPSLIEAQAKEEKKNNDAFQEQRSKVQQTASKIPDLFRRLNTATTDVLNATTATMDGKLQAFRNLRLELHEALRQLPATVERTDYFKKIDALNIDVRNHQEKVAKSLREMRAHVQQRAKANIQKVDDLVAENNGNLLPVFFLAAPEEVQQAVKKLTKNAKVMKALQENEQFLALLGTDRVEEGLLQITSGSAENAIVPISQQNQLAALETLLDVLSQDKSITSKEVALARQFLGTVVSLAKGAQALQNGEKEYLTLVTQKDSFVYVLNASLYDLLNSPETVGNIFSTLLEQGVTQPLHMQFTSRKEAVTLAAVMNNMDAKALTGRMGSLSREELLSLTQGSMSGALVKGSGGELAALTQAKTLPQISTLIARSAGNIEALARVLGIASPKLEQQLTQVMSGLNSHFVGKPTTVRGPEATSNIMKALLTMAFTAQDINAIISLPKGAPQRGAIGDFVASSFYPKVSLGNTVMLLDSSLQADPVGSQLMLGMVPTPLQLINGPKQPPLAIKPQPIVQNDVLVFNRVQSLEQQTHLAEQVAREAREQFAREKEELMRKLAEKLVQVTELHMDQKKLLEKEISQLKAQLLSLTSTSQQTITELEKQVQLMTQEHAKESEKQLQQMKNELEEITAEYDSEKMELQRRLEENGKTMEEMATKFNSEKMELQRRLEENGKTMEEMATKFNSEKMKLQSQLEENAKTMKEMATEFNSERHQSEENLKKVAGIYERKLQELAEENNQLKLQLHKQETVGKEKISHLQEQLKLATDSFQSQLKHQQKMAEDALAEQEMLQQELEESLDVITLYRQQAEGLTQLLLNCESRLRQTELYLDETNKQQRLLIEELLNAQEEPANTLDLSVQAAEYVAFLNEFEKICNVLQVKEAADSIYSDATDAAEDAYQILNEVGEDFFANPTPETLVNFKAICKETMSTAAIELRQHRDIWPAIHPIFRGILGVLATLTVIPALLVAGLSKQGYLGSFFKTTETNSGKELSRVESLFDRVEHSIDQNMQMAF